MVENGGESKQVSEASCRPASCRIAKRALSPLATHCSYRARNSSLVTAAVDVDSRISGEIGGKSLGCTLSRTTLAHLGAAQETMPSTPNEGGGVGSQHCPGLPIPAITPQEGELVWRGEGC
jgi:hypothetical protein